MSGQIVPGEARKRGPRVEHPKRHVICARLTDAELRRFEAVLARVGLRGGTFARKTLLEGIEREERSSRSPGLRKARA